VRSRKNFVLRLNYNSIVAEKNIEQIKIFNSRSLFGQAVLLSAILITLVFGWFSVRWMIGSMMAELASPSDVNVKDVAQNAVNFSPGDPLTNWLAASAAKDDKIAVQMYEKIVQISPNDYRWWIELARSREQLEDFAGSEKAFLRAIEVAPNYSFPHWQIGNFYLRRGDEPKAFAEFQKAAKGSIEYRDQVFSTVWEFYDKDTAKLEQIISDNPQGRASLAKFYASKEKTADSLRIWNTLTTEQKQENQIFSELILQAFYEKKFFRTAIEFAADMGKEPEAKAETVQNGGFESAIKDTTETLFGWRFFPSEKFDVKFDATSKKEGNRSLRLVFNGYTNVEIKNLRQYVTVESNKRYRLTFWVRTENLKSAGTPNLEVVNANDDKVITSTNPFPTGTNDWQQMKLDFVAPANAEAVELRTGRGYCGNSCPIVGTIWYDGFVISRQ
jgi:tetratricopeptide (TPR) repeat protein